jgi:hypothetical protein
MNKMKIIFAATLLISFSVISCEKEAVVPTDDVSVKEAGKGSFRAIPTNCISPSHTLSIDDIVNLHNGDLDAIFINYDYTATNKIAERNSRFLSSTIGLSQQDKQLIIDKVYGRDESYLLSNITPAAAVFITDAKNALASASSFNALTASIAIVHNNICNSNIIPADKVILSTYCEIMLESALWFSGPNSYNIISNLGGSPNDPILIKKIIRTNAAAAAAYMYNLGPNGTVNQKITSAAAAFAAADLMITAM